MAFLRSLQLNKFRSVAKSEQLVFRRDANLLLGLNGSGKTTFLNLLSSIVAENLAGLVAEPVDLAYEIASDDEEHAVNVHVRSQARDTSSADIGEASIARLSADMSTTATVTYTHHKGFRHVTTWDGERLSQFEGESKFLSRGPFERELLGACWTGAVARLGENEELARVVNLFFWEIIVSSFRTIGRFAEDASPYQRIIDSSSIGGFNLRFSIKKREDGTTEIMPFLFGMVCPTTISSEVVAEAERTGQAPVSCDIDLVASQVLSEDALDALGFVKAQARVSLTALRPSQDRVGAEYENCDFLFTRANGEIISSQGLSFGQRRFIALAFLSKVDETGPLFVDELANGLHHRLLDEALECLEGRQSFLTSQNPLLLDSLLIESAEHLKSMFIVTSQEQAVAGEPTCFRLRQLSEDEAARVYEAKEAGFRTLSVILKSMNLW